MVIAIKHRTCVSPLPLGWRHRPRSTTIGLWESGEQSSDRCGFRSQNSRPFLSGHEGRGRRTWVSHTESVINPSNHGADALPPNRLRNRISDHWDVHKSISLAACVIISDQQRSVRCDLCLIWAEGPHAGRDMEAFAVDDARVDSGTQRIAWPSFLCDDRRRRELEQLLDCEA